MKSVRSLIQIRIKKFSESMSTCSTSIFKDPNVAKHLSLLHDKYVIISADKAPNNLVFVCKSHYIDFLIKELGIDNSFGSLHIARRHLQKRISWTIICLFYVPLEFQPKMKNWIYHHWIPKLHKCPFKQRYIAGSANSNAPWNLFPNY